MNRDRLFVLIGFLLLIGFMIIVGAAIREHMMAYDIGYKRGYAQAKEDNKDVDKICIAWWTQTEIKPTIDKICKGQKK